MAYLYDPEGVAQTLMNHETLVTCALTQPHWERQLKMLVERHFAETGSQKAEELLQHWDLEVKNFVQICPIEMLNKLPHPLGIEETAVPAE
jgi:glutamate synthase (NADPH/NADH) large chain